MSKNNTSRATYDLHLHTIWSFDASATAESHLARATELAVRCIAITEHFHMDSVPELLKATERFPQLHVILAATFTITNVTSSSWLEPPRKRAIPSRVSALILSAD